MYISTTRLNWSTACSRHLLWQNRGQGFRTCQGRSEPLPGNLQSGKPSYSIRFSNDSFTYSKKNSIKMRHFSEKSSFLTSWFHQFKPNSPNPLYYDPFSTDHQLQREGCLREGGARPALHLLLHQHGESPFKRGHRCDQEIFALRCGPCYKTSFRHL